MDSETTGYHLFLEPTGALKEKLAGYIHTLAETYGGPVFPPHVTLVGSIPNLEEEEVIAKATALAHTPLTLTLGDLDGEDAYFRAFYIRIEENEALASYYEQACAMFGVPLQTYCPHLSLFYGGVSDTARAAMKDSLPYAAGESFVVDSLSVYRGEGGAEEWQKVAEIPFAIPIR